MTVCMYRDIHTTTLYYVEAYNKLIIKQDYVH